MCVVQKICKLLELRISLIEIKKQRERMWMRPDVEIKSGIFTKVVQKVATEVLLQKGTVFKVNIKVTVNSSYFYYKFCHQEL